MSTTSTPLPSGPTGSTPPNPVSTSSTSVAAASAKKEAAAVKPDPTQTTLTTDVYGMFVGAFFIVLSLIVMFATGSVLSVLVLWGLVALMLFVMLEYDIITMDQLIGKELKKIEEQVQKELPASSSSGGPMLGSEVFHISDQQFTYDEAPAVCAAYGSDLATLEQIMDSYAKGAEWCGYGWSAGGMALYPTQRETWERLQGEVDTGKRTHCGRPGVNGGYFDPSLKFGVNCFGFKPRVAFTPPAPVPGIDDKKFRGMVSKFKEMMKSFTLNPYSRQEWSKYDNRKESFVNSFFNPFRQDFETPHGIQEDFATGDPRYVEPVGQSGLGNQARPLQGPVGLLGDTGARGATGAKGAAGAAGVRGAEGIQGLQGLVGPAGKEVQGDRGPTGGRGPTGSQGERGSSGTGSAGGIGPKGDKGDSGLAGGIGPTGTAGKDGNRGPTGSQGIQGGQGNPGAPGAPGQMPSNAFFNSLQIGNHVIETRGDGTNRLQVRPANGNQDNGLVFDTGDWANMTLSRGGGWKTYD